MCKGLTVRDTLAFAPLYFLHSVICWLAVGLTKSVCFALQVCLFCGDLVCFWVVMFDGSWQSVAFLHVANLAIARL